MAAGMPAGGRHLVRALRGPGPLPVKREKRGFRLSHRPKPGIVIVNSGSCYISIGYCAIDRNSHGPSAAHANGSGILVNPRIMSINPVLASGRMTTYVLVHGAWGGSWGFRLLRGPLRAAGHEVFTPSLTGVGERAHLASPQVNLSTHVLDVVNTILYEDLTDIVLLGFSYGGMVVTGALEHVAERVSHLVYLDAFVPADGQSLDDLAGVGYRPAAVGPGASWLVKPIARPLADEAESAWSAARRTPHPVGCFTEPVRLARPVERYPFTRTAAGRRSGPRPSTRRRARTGATTRSTAIT
jgi:pimeloyl-ACP methyl ester carboxylesterase